MGIFVILGIIAVIILLISITGKSRRAGVMNRAIQHLVDFEGGDAVMSEVYYEAALQFAIESGAKLNTSKFENTSTSFITRIDDENYVVFISKQGNGSTYLRVSKA